MASAQSLNVNNNADDTFKILIATDIHLGYDYNKKRGMDSEDSFVTFEEILQHGKKHEVDFILLGGDLFHDTKPSQTAIIKCMELMRKYCLGPREIKIKFLSDPEVIFQHCTYKTVNYEDPNLNISMPIFSIHGNHDDPSFGAVGSMDLLSVSGLINYFGKWTDLTKITIPPLVIKKGKTCIALYGLSYINDQRLSRLLRDYKVDMLQPENIPNCFNILVLHQNRVQHGSEYAHISQNKFPDFLNLIIWGHEHECRITPEFVTDTEYFVSQPGSSIATSLCEAEAKPKHIGLLSIKDMKFKMKKIKLQTVRPFVFDNLILCDQNISANYNQSLSESVYTFVDDYIENVLVPKAAEQLTNHPKQPIQPLIRLRIFYSSDDEIFDEITLVQKYCDEIANPMDMIVFRKESSRSKNSKGNIDVNDDLDDMAQALAYDNEDNQDWNKTVQGGIKKHFSSDSNKDVLTVLSVNGLNEALNRFVGSGDTDAFKGIIRHQMKKTMAHLETCNVDDTESIIKEIKNFRDKRREKEEEEQQEIKKMFSNTKKTTRKTADTEIVISSDEGEQIQKIPAKAKRGRGTAIRGRGSREHGPGKTNANVKNTLDITTTTRNPKTTKQTKQTQSKLKNFMPTSMSQTNLSKTSYYLQSDDSD
ncbi:double-strand break repair protein MRE11 [Colletes gigas]|uniref:double-strand break repair protein MRE11 n=1 Tax=Colletes gigas TaxID=935657 RepID=UPI001C9B84DD|nr:double-strand break repair protein MRE11 [Colletes gigas]